MADFIETLMGYMGYTYQEAVAEYTALHAADE
jgi:hypothetical protein